MAAKTPDHVIEEVYKQFKASKVGIGEHSVPQGISNVLKKIKKSDLYYADMVPLAQRMVLALIQEFPSQGYEDYRPTSGKHWPWLEQQIKEHIMKNSGGGK